MRCQQADRWRNRVAKQMTTTGVINHKNPEDLIGKRAYRVCPFSLGRCERCKKSRADFSYMNMPVKILSVNTATKEMTLNWRGREDQTSLVDAYWAEWPARLSEYDAPPLLQGALTTRDTCNCWSKINIGD